MAAWIKKEIRLRGHPKLVACAEALDLKPVYLEGHLDSFWLACADRYEDGDVSKLSNVEIAILAEYNTKHADRFVQLLQEHRWLDDHLIHDWLDYAGDYLKSRYRKSPDKLLAIYKKHGREDDLKNRNMSGTCTTRVPDVYGTCQDVDIDLKKETHTTAPPEASDSLLRLCREVIGLTCDTLIDNWVSIWPEEWIILAVSKCQSNGVNGSAAVKYAQRILQDWKTKGGPEHDRTNAGRKPSRANAPKAASRGLADFSDVRTGEPLD